MIILDKILQKRQSDGNPLRVGMTGAGFMASGIAMQLLNNITGIQLSAIYNRNPERARDIYSKAGAKNIEKADNPGTLDKNIRQNKYTVISDPGVIHFPMAQKYRSNRLL